MSCSTSYKSLVCTVKKLEAKIQRLEELIRYDIGPKANSGLKRDLSGNYVIDGDVFIKANLIVGGVSTHKKLISVDHKTDNITTDNFTSRKSNTLSGAVKIGGGTADGAQPGGVSTLTVESEVLFKANVAINDGMGTGASAGASLMCQNLVVARTISDNVSSDPKVLLGVDRASVLCMMNSSTFGTEDKDKGLYPAIASTSSLSCLATLSAPIQYFANSNMNSCGLTILSATASTTASTPTKQPTTKSSLRSTGTSTKYQTFGGGFSHVNVAYGGYNVDNATLGLPEFTPTDKAKQIFKFTASDSPTSPDYSPDAINALSYQNRILGTAPGGSLGTQARILAYDATALTDSATTGTYIQMSAGFDSNPQLVVQPNTMIIPGPNGNRVPSTPPNTFPPDKGIPTAMKNTDEKTPGDPTTASDYTINNKKPFTGEATFNNSVGVPQNTTCTDSD
jgi:hypothetical protein